MTSEPLPLNLSGKGWEHWPHGAIGADQDISDLLLEFEEMATSSV